MTATSQGDRRVTTAQPLRIRAGEFNSWQDAARRVESMFDLGAVNGERFRGNDQTIYHGENATSVNLVRGGIVGIGAIGQSLPATGEFVYHPSLRLTYPTIAGGPIAIALEPIAQGSIGRVALTGALVVDVNVTSASHTQWQLVPRIAPNEHLGEVTHLESVASGGDGQLLWSNGTGQADALIALPRYLVAVQYDRCDALATVNFDGNDATVVVDNITAVRGKSPVTAPTDTITADNDFNFAGLDNDRVAIEYVEGADSWRIYAVENKERLPVVELGFSTPNLQNRTQSIWVPGSAAAGSFTTWHTGDAC